MTRKNIRHGIVFILIFCVFISSAFAGKVGYDSFLDRAVKGIVSKVDGKRLAVMPLEGAPEEFNALYISDMESYLIGEGVSVLNRSNIESIIKELEFQTSGMVNEFDAVSIGNMMGAEVMVMGSARNMVSYNHIELKLVDLKTTMVLYQGNFDLNYDDELINMMAKSKGRGFQNFGIGLRGSFGFGFSKAHADMIGEGQTVKIDNFIPFGGALTLDYRFLKYLGIQTEVDFLVGNGVKASDSTYKLNIKFSSIDIPLMIKFYPIHSPVLVSAYAGGYLSIPVSDLTMEGYNYYFDFPINRAVKLEGLVWGVLGGIDVGVPVGPGEIMVDVRYMHDFGTHNAMIPDNMLELQPRGVMYRRNLMISAGYRFAL